MSEDIIASIMALFFSVIILWISSLSMIKHRTISYYLPFFFLGVLLVFHSTLVAYGIFLIIVWLFLELAFFLDLVWIYFVFRREVR